MTTPASDVTYTAPGSSVARTVDAKLSESISVKDFGAYGDGDVTATHDDTTAIQNAVNAACNTYNRVVHFPCGVYNVSGTITIPQGVLLRGEGSQGSQKAHGTVIRHTAGTVIEGAGVDLFVFDGNASNSNLGTGGGLENFQIMKGLRTYNDPNNLFGWKTNAGGVAIRIKATAYDSSQNPDLDKRAGEMMLTNLLVLAEGDKLWDHGLVVNGTVANELGSRGVRHTCLRKVRVAECLQARKYVWLNQVTHFYAHGLSIDTGVGGAAAAGMTLEGINDSVYLNAFNNAGSLEIVPYEEDVDATTNFHVDGKIQGQFKNYDANLTGTMRVSGLTTTGTELVNKSPRLKIMSDAAPRVLVTKESPQNSITGDGTVANVIFDTSTTNYFGNYATTGANEGRFTCTVAGVYRISYTYLLKNIDTGHTRLDSSIRHSDSLTTPVFLRRYTKTLNPANMAVPPSSNGFLAVSDSVTIEMKYDDVMYLETKVSNSTKTVGVYGGSGTVYSWMSIDYLS